MKKLFSIIFLLIVSLQFLKAETFKAGSYIIDMGVQPQTYANGLQPYGLLFDLAIKDEIPVYWIINPNKQLFGVDFTYDDGTTIKDYSGSAFVIPAFYINQTVLDDINFWKGKGVIVDGPMASDFDAPAYNYITSFPNAIIDQQNVQLVIDMFYHYTSSGTHGIPGSYYTTGKPDSITSCSDVYALPHADPQTWTTAEIDTYKSFIDNAKGFLWQGCHSVGAVEAHSGSTSAIETLFFAADSNIQVKDDGGFEIKDNFPDINITTNVTITAKKFKLGKNITINVLSGGSLHISTKDGITIGSGSSINTIGTGVYTNDKSGDKSGNGNDGDLKTPTTIDANKQYNKVSLDIAGGGTTANFLNMFILTTNGQIAWQNDPDYTFTNKNSPAFDYELTAGAEPIMQIASKDSDPSGSAQGDGSQEIYIPRPDSAWRSTTTVGIWDPDNVNLGLNGGNPNKAALLAFGRAYGDTTNGIVVQQASHTNRAGTESQNVTAARFYGNLLLQAAIEKRPEITITTESELVAGSAATLRATVTGGTSPYNFNWSMTCSDNNNTGTFSPNPDNNVTESQVTFTPTGTSFSNCVLRVKVTDSCNRKNFQTLITYISVYNPPLGYFNITHEGETFSSTGGKDSINSNGTNSKRQIDALYTQISTKPFNVKAVHLAADKETLATLKGNIILELINPDGVTDLDPSSCAKATPYADVTSSVTLNANGSHFDNNSSINITNISYPISKKKISFRVKYHDFNATNYIFGIPTTMTPTDAGNSFPSCTNDCNSSFTDWSCYKCIATKYGKSTCARDDFSIRPATYSLDLNDSEPYVGGRSYTIDINATEYNSSLDSGYNQTITQTAEKNVSAVLKIPVGCSLTSISSVMSNDVNFTDGVGTPSIYSYNNVGKVDIIVTDANWTAKDMGKNDQGTVYSDCIEGNASNVAINGKVGCLVKGVKTVTFHPLTFKNSLAIQNFNNGNFTYINSDRNMSARLLLKTTAILDNNTTASNYTARCYSRDINTTISLRSTNVVWDDNWTNESNATQRIRFFDDKNITSNFENNNTVAQTTFSSSEGNFTNGVADINMTFNFQRFANIPDNPFKIARDDFNVTVIDTNDTNGSDFNRTANDYNATFYYGRVHAPDYRFAGTDGNATIYYEVYDSNSLNRIDYNITGSESVNSINWYVNKSHTNNDGNVSQYQSKDGVTFNGNNIIANSGAITSGTENINLTAPKTPYKDKIIMSPSPWLIFNLTDQNATTDDFQVEFYGAGTNWAGQGGGGHAVDTNISHKQNRRLDW